MLKFGQHVIQQSCVFWESKLSFAFVNIKPVLPGHVLVSPKRIEPYFTNLSPEENVDLFKGLYFLMLLKIFLSVKYHPLIMWKIFDYYNIISHYMSPYYYLFALTS